MEFVVNNREVYNKRKRKKKKIIFTSVCKVSVSYAVNLVGVCDTQRKNNYKIKLNL
jgi:hypothetical protein